MGRSILNLLSRRGTTNPFYHKGDRFIYLFILLYLKENENILVRSNVKQHSDYDDI